jgi:CRP/FNR family transcriptional regulator, cyclic AMP receptor protein
MSEHKLCDIVRHSSLAADLTEEECLGLAERVSHLHLTDGQMLLTEGTIDHTLYVIVSGRLEVVKETGGGEVVTLCVHGVGDMVGELGFIDGSAHSASVRALGECQVLTLERSALELLIGDYPGVCYKLMRTLLHTVHAILRRMNIQFVELSNYVTHQHGRY